MRKGWISLGLVALITLSTMSPSAAAIASAGSPASDVVAQINAVRGQNGLAPLVVQSQLNASAQGFAQAMAAGRFFAHVAPNGSTMASRDEASGYTGWTNLEENIAAGQTTPAAVVNAWMQSPPHRGNLLSPKVTDTGVGFVYVPGSPYGYYWVQEFGAETAPVAHLVAPAIPTMAPAAVPVTPAAVPGALASIPPVPPAAPRIVAAAPAAPSAAVAAALILPTTPVLVPAPPIAPASVAVASDSLTVDGPPAFVRTQRDPDNLNLYLYVESMLGFD